MRRDVIDAARKIPAALQRTVASMFEEGEDALRRGVAELKDALRTVSDYVQSIEVPKGRPGRKPGKQVGVSPAAPPTVRRRRRGSKRFQTGPFILETLKGHPRGMRPRDIAEALGKEAPGAHKKPLSVVNTTLARQASLKQVRKLGPGLWALGPNAAPGQSTKATSPTRTAGRRKGRKTGKGSRAGAFGATPFILKAVQDAGQAGVRPKDIVAKVEAAAPGHHTRTSALVSTILARLKARGQVKKTPSGIWKAA